MILENLRQNALEIGSMQEKEKELKSLWTIDLWAMMYIWESSRGNYLRRILLMISTWVKFSESQKAKQDKKRPLSNTSTKKYWYAVSKGSFTLNDLKLTWEAKAFYPLGAYIGLIFCNTLFQWDIFWYFTLNILWLSQSWRWSETFFDTVVEYSTCKYCTWELFEWQTQ